MRSLSLGLFALVASSLACMHEGSRNSASKAVSAYQESEQDLGGEINSRPLPMSLSAKAKVPEDKCASALQGICTREYNPQKCSYAGNTIEAGNPCDAGLKAKYIACKNSVAYKADELVCNSAEALKGSNQ